MDFFETSARTGKGVEDAFTTVAKKLMIKKQQAIAEKKEKSRQKPSSGLATTEKNEKPKEDSKISLDQSKNKTQPKDDGNNCNC